eukprot:Gb_15990 [translate_table: standard]
MLNNKTLIAVVCAQTAANYILDLVFLHVIAHKMKASIYPAYIHLETPYLILETTILIRSVESKQIFHLMGLISFISLLGGLPMDGLVVDFFSEYLHIPRQEPYRLVLSRYLNEGTDYPRYGINFASGGSGLIASTNIESVCICALFSDTNAGAGSTLQDYFENMTLQIPHNFPGTLAVYGSTYDVVELFRTSPAKFGFKVTGSACCGSGHLKGEFQCGNVENSSMCDKPHEYLFWDFFHP